MVLAISASVWATTIGTNISGSGSLSSGTTLSVGTDLNVSSGARIGSATDGTHITALADNTLLVVGQSEFDGIAWFDASLQASSTLLVTGATTLYGALTVGDAGADTLTITSNSVVYSNNSTSTIPTNANSFAVATTSADIPLFKIDATNTRVGIGTTTPSKTFSVNGDGTALFTGSGTSTLSLTSNTTGTGVNSRGGCLELEAADGSGVVAVYVSIAATTTLMVTQGACR